ncbi:hypothetical protein R9X47_28745 [Wukongibacter baidiensis]|uniref:hypothetical protein n=1 Tax=Wukongibacter baidiensis TaxID=1723361 RepID=UPI003D7FA1D3
MDLELDKASIKPKDIIIEDFYFDIIKFDDDCKPMEGYIEEYNVKVNTIGCFKNSKEVFIGSLKDGNYNGMGMRIVYDGGSEWIKIGEFANGNLCNGDEMIKKGDRIEEFKKIANGIIIKEWIDLEESGRNVKIVFEDEAKLGNGEIRENGKVQYKGEMSKSHIKEGVGTLFHPNEKKMYVGEFKNGKFEGEGELYTEEGDLVFKGIFINDEPWDGCMYEFEHKYTRGIRLGIANVIIAQASELLSSELEAYLYECLFRGKLEEGKPNGECKININGKDYDVKYENGRLINFKKFIVEVKKDVETS